MHTIDIGHWRLYLQDTENPLHLYHYVSKAAYVDQTNLDAQGQRTFFLAISIGNEKASDPQFVSVQKYDDPHQQFSPRVLVVPETGLVFIGAGERLLCYNVVERSKLWEDQTMAGIWAWDRTDEFVLLSAELEFGVYTLDGTKLWSTFVEPPWSFNIKGDSVELDVMGDKRLLKLADGSPAIQLT